jgi:hypothetical protein
MILGAMVGSMSEAMVWERLAERTSWKTLDRDFPRFSETLELLAGTMRKIFARNMDFLESQIAVFSTGRLACEDLYEIAYLAEHGLGFAALKLLRGIYERTVVGRFIALNPDQAEAFGEYRAIDARRYDRRAAEVYGAKWNPKRDAEMQKLFDHIKHKYKWEACDKCGLTPQPSFSEHSLPVLARKINEVLETMIINGKEKKITMEDAYLLCAAIPNAHIHASMWSFVQRLKVTGQDAVWNNNQEWQAEFALSSAHDMMRIVFKTQNEYFQLGLEEEIEQRRLEWHRVWISSKPSKESQR